MTLRPLLLLTTAALASAGCAYDFPRPKLPQVEETVEMVESQGDRFAAHRSCVRAAPELGPLLECMEAAGFIFTARGPDYPHAQCWQLRDQANADLPPAYCWERAGSGTPPP
jgi:hypothetical protein